MDYLYSSVLCASSGTLAMVFVYVYLYFMYRERYMGMWAVGWIILSLRNVFFDLGLFDWKYSVVGFIIYQLSFIVCVLLFISSIHIFVDKPVKKHWIYCAISVSIVSAIFTFLDLPIFYKLSLTAWFSGIIVIYIGRFFISTIQIRGVGNKITGYAFILWGLLTMCMPYSISVAGLITWSYVIGGILRIIIAAGTLMVYLEKTRRDLVKKEAYHLFAENSVDVIYRYQLLPEVKFKYINPAVFEVTGYTPEEYYADAKLFISLIHHEDLVSFQAYTSNLLPNDLPLEYRLIHRDQHMVWIEQKFHPIYDEAGKLVMREGILRDVTARNYIEQIETQIDRMNMVGEMAVTVAHEVCNPLTTIRGYLQFSKEKENIRKERFDLMIEELDRISSIINEYLLLAQNKRVNLKNCCLNSIVKNLLPLIETYGIASNINIRLELGDIPDILIDENEIRFLVLNLVRNGVEAMSSEGELTICTGIERGGIVLTIKDQGIGIATYVVDEIGTSFVTTKATGTGLGLPTCYRIAQRHNATIDFRTSNQGTTFFVYFNPNIVA